MKKIVALFLIVAMSISFAACGNSDNKSSKDSIENVLTISEYGLLTFKTDKAFREHVKKVELTKDNWKEYFEDCDYEEHVVEKNDFGDVEREYDETHFEFRMKEDMLILTTSVAFKFDGRTELNADWNDDNSLNKENSTIDKFKANSSTYTRYNYATKELICEDVHDNVREYYLVEFDNYNTYVYREHYTEHNCIDVKGTIYVIENVPKEILEAERIERSQIFVQNKGLFQIENLDTLFED